MNSDSKNNLSHLAILTPSEPGDDDVFAEGTPVSQRTTFNNKLNQYVLRSTLANKVARDFLSEACM